jgi:hypothetical protein
MRKFLISAALAATALTAAVPAAAQYAPYPPYGGQYGAPYGQAYGHNATRYRHVQQMEARVWQLRREIDRLDARNILSEREADRLRGQANDLRRELRFAARGGVNAYEHQRIDRRIAALEYRIRREAMDGNRWGDRRYGERDWADRDRDGRNDRWEDDRGHDHD